MPQPPLLPLLLQLLLLLLLLLHSALAGSCSGACTASLSPRDVRGAAAEHSAAEEEGGALRVNRAAG
jgi:hypothetical protein